MSIQEIKELKFTSSQCKISGNWKAEILEGDQVINSSQPIFLSPTKAIEYARKITPIPYDKDSETGRI